MIHIIPRIIRTYIYDVILRPKFFRAAANFIISIFIKDKYRIPEGLVALNKKDPIVSGALALGFYEKNEAEFIRTQVKPGLTVIDIGANVGFYTAIFAKLVGSQGRVISFEPEPENFKFLEKTIQLNDFKNIFAYQLAVSDQSGQGQLFLDKNNKGDHRLYSDGKITRQTIDISQTSLDDFLIKLNIDQVDLIKMDIQGAEGLVLKGMVNTLRKNKNIKLFLEFWPWGLKQLNTDPLDLLNSLRQWGFKIFRIKESSVGLEEIFDDNYLIKKYTSKKYAHLFCPRT